MKAIYIPAGPKNLATLFPTINFNDVSEYFIELVNGDDAVIATSNLYRMERCTDEMVRIHFLNSLGTIDAVNFLLATIEQEVKSDAFEESTKYPLNKPDHSAGRFNVKSNDTYTAKTNDYAEEDMVWMQELFSSPLAWIEWKGIQGQPDSYLPITIIDQKVVNRKEEERYINEVTIQFKMSNEKFIIRN